jgi:hypothetical protein
MTCYDIQSALEIIERLQSIKRRAEMFGKSKEDLLLEIEFMTQDYSNLVSRIERSMEEAYHG